MKARRILPLVVLAVALSLFVAGTAGATTATTSFPTVSVAGAIGFDNQGTASFASFAARAVGPALPGEDHQPARGFMTYADKTGLTFAASIQHIHGHSAVEVHFGGPITRASDPSLVGMFVHCVAIDGGSPGRNGDLFSVLVTSSDEHQHGAPSPVRFGDLVVRAPAM